MSPRARRGTQADHRMAGGGKPRGSFYTRRSVKGHHDNSTVHRCPPAGERAS